MGVNEAYKQLDITILACFPRHMGKGLLTSRYEFLCAGVTHSETPWDTLGHYETL